MSVDSPAAQPATPDSLIEQCLSGDQGAWEIIVRQNWRKVFNVAYKFVGRHEEASIAVLVLAGVVALASAGLSLL